MFLGLSFYFIIFDFFLYSILGWIYETIYESVRAKCLVNRGFLTGPIIPVYGFGAVLIYLFLRPLAHHPSVLFLGGMIFATSIEYLTAVALEKIFHTQWWTYDYFQFNFQNRIALVPSLFWGFMTLLDFDFLQPGMTYIINLFPYKTGLFVLHVLAVTFILDLIFTTISSISFTKQLETLFSLNKEIEAYLKDSKYSKIFEAFSNKTASLSEYTDTLKKRFSEFRDSKQDNDSTLSVIENKIRNYAEKHNQFFKPTMFTNNKRIFKAFPNMKFIPKKPGNPFKKSTYVHVKNFILDFRKKSK